MTRIMAREIAAALCFAAEANDAPVDELESLFFSPDHYETLGTQSDLFAEAPGEHLSYIDTIVRLSREHHDEIDHYISKYARDWKPERISHTARAILGVALCEILFMSDIPPAVSINEAVELDKKYDTPETVSFVNGVLGGFMRGEMPSKEEQETE